MRISDSLRGTLPRDQVQERGGALCTAELSASLVAELEVDTRESFSHVADLFSCGGRAVRQA